MLIFCYNFSYNFSNIVMWNDRIDTISKNGLWAHREPSTSNKMCVKIALTQMRNRLTGTLDKLGRLHSEACPKKLPVVCEILHHIQKRDTMIQCLVVRICLHFIYILNCLQFLFTFPISDQKWKKIFWEDLWQLFCKMCRWNWASWPHNAAWTSCCEWLHVNIMSVCLSVRILNIVLHVSCPVIPLPHSFHNYNFVCLMSLFVSHSCW